MSSAKADDHDSGEETEDEVDNASAPPAKKQCVESSPGLRRPVPGGGSSPYAYTGM